MQTSGKLVILGILSLAVAAAAASWSFRYAATNEAARFWGPNVTRLIRDAPTVELYLWNQLPEAANESGLTNDLFVEVIGRDLSHTPGLIHLRYALLEDQSFHWPAQQRSERWRWALVFRDPGTQRAAVLRFSKDWQAVDSLGRQQTLSCEPIAHGLEEMLGGLARDDRAPR